ncbi:MAG: type II toxin-antitoxin system VapC family toxin [Saprospiraceae bacterium]|nr:type II toxin-antitoxin system VapC family toxin [Saprospiraceae bacterium]
MKKYLLDTNICIFYFKDKHDIEAKIKAAGVENVFISEITIAELKFGVANTEDPTKREKNREAVINFQNAANIIPIISVLDIYASERARLKNLGKSVDDFDLLIGSTALTHDLVMVTNNVKHLERLKGILIEDWTKS